MAHQQFADEFPYAAEALKKLPDEAYIRRLEVVHVVLGASPQLHEAKALTRAFEAAEDAIARQLVARTAPGYRVNEDVFHRLVDMLVWKRHGPPARRNHFLYPKNHAPTDQPWSAEFTRLSDKIRAEAPAPAPAVKLQQPRTAGKEIRSSPAPPASAPAPARPRPAGKNLAFSGPSASPQASPMAGPVPSPARDTKIPGSATAGIPVASRRQELWDAYMGEVALFPDTEPWEIPFSRAQALMYATERAVIDCRKVIPEEVTLKLRPRANPEDGVTVLVCFRDGEVDDHNLCHVKNLCETYATMVDYHRRVHWDDPTLDSMADHFSEAAVESMNMAKRSIAMEGLKGLSIQD